MDQEHDKYFYLYTMEVLGAHICLWNIAFSLRITVEFDSAISFSTVRHNPHPLFCTYTVPSKLDVFRKIMSLVSYSGHMKEFSFTNTNTNANYYYLKKNNLNLSDTAAPFKTQTFDHHTLLYSVFKLYIYFITFNMYVFFTLSSFVSYMQKKWGEMKRIT